MNKYFVAIIVILIIFVFIYLAKEQYLKEGFNKTVVANDEKGNAIYDYDVAGNPIYGYDTNGKPIFQTYSFDGFKKDFQKDVSLDINYHDDITDNDGLDYLAVKPTINNLSDFQYGSLTYVPNYEDSVYLSRTSNMKVGKTVIETSSIKGGICNYYKSNPDKLEQACQNTNPNVCASTSCCVLLGGAKCVSGNRTGPTMKSHYSNTMIPNRDYYYFQSKCYGNCPLN